MYGTAVRGRNSICELKKKKEMKAKTGIETQNSRDHDRTLDKITVFIVVVTMDIWLKIDDISMEMFNGLSMLHNIVFLDTHTSNMHQNANNPCSHADKLS